MQVGDRKAREKMLHAHTLPLLDVLRRLYTYVSRLKLILSNS